MVFNTAYLALDVALGGGIGLHRLLSPAFALWYILSLIYWRIILQLVPQSVLDRKMLVMTFALMASLVAGFIPVGCELSFQRACTFFPFFMLGYYAKQDGWVVRLRTLNKIPWTIVLIGLLSACYWALPVFYSNTPYKTWTDCGMRALQLIVASVLSLAIMNVMPTKMGRFTDIGKFTLLVYLLHPPMIKVMKVACQYAGVEQNPLIGIAMTMVTVVAIYSVRNIKIFRYLV